MRSTQEHMNIVRIFPFLKLYNFKFPILSLQIMSNVDKAGLINDAFNLARGRYISYDIPLDMTLYLDQEMSHLPWESAYTAMAYISDMLQTGTLFGSWRVCSDI